jgi:hypothetical protein
VKDANLALRFGCEIAGLVGLAWCGWEITPVLGALFPLAFASVWGVVVAPRARRRLPDPWRFALEVALFAAATAAFLSVGQTVIAVVFACVAAVTAVLVRVWPEPVTG